MIRERIFIETMERVLGGMDKIIIDQNGQQGGGVVPYLPLNELQRRAPAGSLRSAAAAGSHAMNNPVIRTGLLILLGVVAVVLFASVFTVQQTQYALVLRFGAVRADIRDPGLHFKLPLIDNVLYFDKRVLDLDLPVQTVLSADRQNLEVDAFTRYRITDPLRFFQAANNITLANQRLTSFTNSSLRNVLASASRDAIVRTERARLMNRIQDDVNRQAQSLGIELIDLRLTRVDLPAANSQAVYQRMRTEREREAADLRANGQQQAQTIRARAEREATVIRAEANRQSEELRGQGDAEKNRILAEAFGRDPDFFAFYRSMQAYEAGLKPGRHPPRPEPDFGVLPLLQRRVRPAQGRAADSARQAGAAAAGAAPASLPRLAVTGLDVRPRRSPRPRTCGRGPFVRGFSRRGPPGDVRGGPYAERPDAARRDHLRRCRCFDRLGRPPGRLTARRVPAAFALE